MRGPATLAEPAREITPRRAPFVRSPLFVVCVVLVALAPSLDAALYALGRLHALPAHGQSLTLLYRWGTTWVGGFSAGDSWDVMIDAYRWLQAHPGGRIYEQLFFVEHTKFQYPLTSLLPFALLSAAGVQVGQVGLNAASQIAVALDVLVAGWMTFRLAQATPLRDARWPLAIAFALATLLFYPLMRALELGQIQTGIDLLFALAACAWLGGRRALAGVLIGLICLLKPQFSLFFVWALLRRERGFAIAWLVVVATGWLAALGAFGVQNNVDYVAVLRALSSTGEVYQANQSVNGMLNRLLGTGDPFTWDAHGFPRVDPVVHIGTLVSSAAMIAAALFVPRRGHGASSFLDFLLAALTFTIASPIAWEHHYGIASTVFIGAAFALLRRRASAARVAGFVALAASYALTAHWLPGSALMVGALILLVLVHVLTFADAGRFESGGAPRRRRHLRVVPPMETDGRSVAWGRQLFPPMRSLRLRG